MVIKQSNTCTESHPQIILTDKTPSLEFEAKESIKIELDVKVLNLDLRKCDVIIDCKASGIGNFESWSKTETNFTEGILFIHAINNCCGSTITVTAYEKITDFPIQPIVVGTRDIIDNTFHPEEQKETKRALEAKGKTEAKETLNTEGGTTSASTDISESTNHKEEEPKTPLTKFSEDGIIIEILDGNTPIQKNFIKYVNLPKKTEFLEVTDSSGVVRNKGLKGLYQLDREIKYRVTFNSRTNSTFNLYLVASSSNHSEYTKSERERNDKFRYLNVIDTTNPKKTLVKQNINTTVTDTLSLTSAGGNIYQLILEENSVLTSTLNYGINAINSIRQLFASTNTISHRTNMPKAGSVQITTQRKLYYVEINIKKRGLPKKYDILDPNLGDKPSCAMYGGQIKENGKAEEVTAFCENCAKSLKKLDLSRV